MTSLPLILTESLEALADPVILIDQRKTIIHFNKAASEAWPALAAGAPLSFTLRAPDLVESIEEVLADRMRECEGIFSERHPVERDFSFRIRGFQDQDSFSTRSVPAAIVIIRDLTEARRLESMRVDFVANASHELRTPLASLIGFIETLQGPARDDPKAQARFLSIMREQGRRMARLIDDLLSLSRVEMSEHKRPLETVDLTSIIQQSVDTLRPMASQRGVTLEIKFSDHPYLVPGDRDELMRVVENLVENGIKYGHAGQRVEVDLQPLAGESTDDLALSIRDFGDGIAAEHLPRLTERFYRVDASASRESGGTGLGLAIVKHIVNRHRGRLLIESEKGQGSVFRVILPRTASSL
jgi:two-component system phosphate regulon sensor histidine kinase PhoR